MFPWEVLITGAVGLAGIGGTLWSGKRSINAENERNRRAEKQHIYTTCLAGFNELASAVITFKIMRQTGAVGLEELNSARARQTRAQESIQESASLLSLIAPRDVCDRADHLLDGIMQMMMAAFDGDFNSPAASVDRSGQLEGDLIRAMRADLGETH